MWAVLKGECVKKKKNSYSKIDRNFCTSWCVCSFLSIKHVQRERITKIQSSLMETLKSVY